MLLKFHVKIKNKAKYIINRMLSNKWVFTKFENIQDHINKKINLYPNESFHYVQEHANPSDLYYYQTEKSIYILENVVVWPHYSVVATKNKSLVKDSAYSHHRFKYFVENDNLKKYRIIKENEPCTAIEIGHWSNYYHWFVDSVPRLYALHHPEIQRLKSIKLYLSDNISSDYVDIIKKLIPSNVEIIYKSHNSRILAKSYIHLPYLTTDWAGHLPKDYIEFYRWSIYSLYDLSPKTFKRNNNIFITRKNADCRKIINEEELYPMLQKKGFSVHQLEKMKLKDQIALFVDANAIIGQHGAGLTNMLYSENATVIELFSTNYPGLYHYRLLASSLGHTYGNIYIKNIFRPDELQVPWRIKYTPKVVNNDVVVDVREIENKINEMIKIR